VITQLAQMAVLTTTMSDSNKYVRLSASASVARRAEERLCDRLEQLPLAGRRETFTKSIPRWI
jgi:hypothetical protein